MTNPHTYVRLLILLRRAWNDYRSGPGRAFTEDSAEDFLASAQDALATLADELRAQLRLGVATEVRIFQDEQQWYVAVYFPDRRARRRELGRYFEMPSHPTEDAMRQAVVEVAFVHNVEVQPYDVHVDTAQGFASWCRY